MIHNKFRYLLTLVALLAVTTGAWATVYTEAVEITALKRGDILAPGFSITPSSNYSQNSITIFYWKTSQDMDWDGTSPYTFWFEAPSNGAKITGFGDGASINAAQNTWYPLDQSTCSSQTMSGEQGNAWEVTAVGAQGTANYIVELAGTYYDPNASSSSGPEVAWDKASKTGTFTMPGGNVELEPEYYPQATVADGGVTAADADARATTDDPLVKVDATKLTGAKKLMYFVSNSGTTAPAYDAEGWTDQLPTAEGFTQQGIVYVWYYPVGIDEGVDGATATYSDGDICLQSITARIAAAPTYAVTFAEGTDPNEWTASPNTGVTKGQTVTVTYTGTKKVIGVKAEKKAAAPATVLSGAFVDGATIKVNFKWRMENSGDYVQGVYNAASGTFTVSKGGYDWSYDDRAVYKVEKSGDNIIIGASFNNFSESEAMVWTFNTTNDTYTTTNGTTVNDHPDWYGLISVTLNGTDITSQLTAQ